MHELSTKNSKILQQDYSDIIEFFISVPVNHIDALKENLLNLSSGKITFIPSEDSASK
jgi:hypothetical protein